MNAAIIIYPKSVTAGRKIEEVINENEFFKAEYSWMHEGYMFPCKLESISEQEEELRRLLDAKGTIYAVRKSY